MPEDALNGHRPGLKPRLNGCLSRMQGNLHVRFLGGDMTVRSYPYPTAYEGSIPFTRSSFLTTPRRGAQVRRHAAHSSPA